MLSSARTSIACQHCLAQGGRAISPPLKRARAQSHLGAVDRGRVGENRTFDQLPPIHLPRGNLERDYMALCVESSGLVLAQTEVWSRGWYLCFIEELNWDADCAGHDGGFSGVGIEG